MSEIKNDEEHEQEEDWSAYATTTGGAAFARHERAIIRLSNTHSLDIQCISSLSPLDMMNLSSGTHDATGQRVWMGALFFIEVLATSKNNERMADLLKRCFCNQHVVELGCGTGVSGISLLSAGKDEFRPATITFTDSSVDVLDVCRQNCERNLVGSRDDCWNVQKLEWGSGSSVLKEEFATINTVLATDVLYDVSMLQPLLLTVQNLLQHATDKSGAYFVLAHIPRASLPGESRVGTRQELEGYILSKIAEHSLKLVTVIRPREHHGLNGVSLETMDEIGASVLIFTTVNDK